MFRIEAPVARLLTSDTRQRGNNQSATVPTTPDEPIEDALAHWSSVFYSFGPSISLPIFQGGALVSNLRVSKAQQAQAALEYRNTVLLALRDVDNALAVYRTDQTRRTSLERSAAAQQDAFDVARESYRKGLATFINVPDAERQLSQVRQQYTQSTTQVSTDLVALYKALGGGWTLTPAARSGVSPRAPDAPASVDAPPAAQALNAPAAR
ncbi:TolC family protein [Paraburkholderia humisilvae]|uniref:Outer membrane protein OprM n=1 Tax=Paraburkholderia humisilvae TaxID=627669 RepID=A0A6J5F599_9BURK|nr:TolC family protein [Paraburkholderia humisilvae]CAB3772931.1 hypothetical protein LMG29542_07036 [Paraburkholderia humisilvae]